MMMLISACSTQPVQTRVPSNLGNAMDIVQFSDHGEHYFGLGRDCPSPSMKTPLVRDNLLIEKKRKIRPPSVTDESGIVVYFSFNSSLLSEYSKDQLQRFLDSIPFRSAEGLKIVGYTDSIGAKSYNDWLAVQRAKSVHHFVNTSPPHLPVVSVSGQGKCCYVNRNLTNAERANNRRAIISIVKNAETLEKET